MSRSLVQRAIRLWNGIRGILNPVGYSRSLGMRVGKNCRILANPIKCFGSEPYLVTLGDYVTITSGVRFITHDGGVWIFRDKYPDAEVFGRITVGNNVFIGMNAIILPGVTIGDHCIIGAGAVVTQNIPSNYVAAGVPARCIKTTEEYWKDIHHKATYFRSLPPKEKRACIEKKFTENKNL